MKSRNAVGLIELIIAAALLITIMTISGRLITSSQRAWQQTRYERLANEELCNHIDVLRTFPREELDARLLELKLSDWISQILPNPQLAGETIQDELGERVRLTIRWETPSGNAHRDLIAWLNPPNSEASALAEENL